MSQPLSLDSHRRTEPQLRQLKNCPTDRRIVSKFNSDSFTSDELHITIRKLQEQISLQQKEIQRLTYINEYLLKANQSKLNILREERQTVNIHKTQQIRHTKTLGQSSTDKKPILAKFFEENSPVLKQNKFQRKKTFRNPTFTRLSIDQESDLNKSEKNISQNFFDILQQEDCFKTNTILNLNINDSDALSQYENDGTVQLMTELLKNEEFFTEVIQSISPQKLSFIYDKLKRIMSDHTQLFKLVLRLKKIVMGALQMNSSVLLDDALNTIIERCTDCLDCERASCFVVDQNKKEIWTRVAKGAQSTIRLSIGQGLAGHVAATHQILNIENAYLDQRFNPAMDIKTNYKTQTLLVCPVIEGDKCIGVLQCVNKKEGYFTKDDEALLQILSEFSRSVLKNALNYDAQMLIQNKLRHLVKTSIFLQTKIGNLQGTLYQAEERLRSMMNVDGAKVVFFHQGQLFHLNKESTILTVEPGIGIVGFCLKQQTTLAISNCYTHPQFNPNIDIETNMPP
ncbi:hypothetical protein pb186bvf_004783 [Paramecium bursaria]